MTTTTAPEPEGISFEKGYDRLKEIADLVAGDGVPVHDMCDLFDEGKALDKALTDYLAEQKTRVDKIEKGEAGIRAFRVTAPSDADGATGRSDVPANTDDFAAAPVAPVTPAPDDDIPF